MKIIKTQTTEFAPVLITICIENAAEAVALVAAARKLPWTAMTDGSINPDLADVICHVTDTIGSAVEEEIYRRTQDGETAVVLEAVKVYEVRK